jgi:hypothetical protein
MKTYCGEEDSNLAVLEWWMDDLMNTGSLFSTDNNNTLTESKISEALILRV